MSLTTTEREKYERVWQAPSIHDIRDRAAAQLALLPYGVLTADAAYPTGLTQQLSTLKAELMAAARSR